MFKKILVHAKRSIKMIILMAVALLLILFFVASSYKVSYSVSIAGEVVGYTDNKSKLQTQINDYIEKGEGENSAFVQVDNLPEYNICLLKRNEASNDEEILNKIKEDGTTYYRYYAILDGEEEKAYVSSFAEAEEIVNTLTEKNSNNKDELSIEEKYETELKEFEEVADVVDELYVEPPKKVTVASNRYASSGTANIASNISNSSVSLGISLIRPVSGIISSRFGVGSSIRRSAHTGLDIATSTGTPVVAAAGGTVTFSGWQGSYGNLLIITHANGVQTYYGHCSALYVSAGQTVSQGQKIAAVGSTGNSTGPHLHFEIRVNGVAYNPQNFLY